MEEKIKNMEEKIKSFELKMDNIRKQLFLLTDMSKSFVKYEYHEPTLNEIKGCVIYDSEPTTTIAFRKSNGTIVKFVEIPMEKNLCI